MSKPTGYFASAVFVFVGICIAIIGLHAAHATTQPAFSITSFTLYNADTGKPIQTLSASSTIDISKLTTKNLTIIANIAGTVGSIRFNLNGNSNYRIESTKPFDIAGDSNTGSNSTLYPWAYALNTTYTLIGTPYTLGNAAGVAGTSQLIRIMFVNNGAVPTGTNPPPVTQPPTDPILNPPITPNPTSGTAPAPVINFLNATTYEGSSIHADALNSTLNAGTPITTTYSWDFGDSGSSFNQLKGWNVAHVYAKQGTYTVTLTLTNSAGFSKTVSSTVTVKPANRRKIYVSANGNDSASGLSSSAAIKTFDKAVTFLSDNTEILFRNGDTFTMTKGMPISSKNNVLIGAYSDGSTARPILKYTGPLNDASIIDISSSNNVTVKDLSFTSIYPTNFDGLPTGIGTGGHYDVVQNDYFDNLSFGVNGNNGPTGVIVLNSSSAPDLNGYFAWVQGSDQVYVGNTALDSVWQHTLRSGGTSRLLIAYNTFANEPVPVLKGTLSIHKGDYIYIANNTLSDSNSSVGPLDGGDALDDKGARSHWIVIENNTINNATFQVKSGAEHVSMRGNIFNDDGKTAIQVDGYNSQYSRGVVDVDINGNTGINNGTTGKFLTAGADIQGIMLRNNVYRAPNLKPGSYGTSAVDIENTDLRDFSVISGNTWPTTKNILVNGANSSVMNYVSIVSGTLSGYKTAAAWNAYPQVNNRDTFNNVTTTAQPASIFLSNISSLQIVALLTALVGLLYAVYLFFKNSKYASK